ncbi:hypothetical protein, unknown function [Leishmania tarentolae]|uniref:DUF3824 domain-containing protein n=1 Tax=Leishmania tarentolae TaxID=5689 RepID=A0A640KC33_LEITA|nr:hypothetical protein, unknown function [Leishmania tarentolae]
MEPGMHTQRQPSAASPSPYAQSESSWQQYPQSRTDMTVGSFINNSAADPSNKSALAAVTASSRGPSYEVLCTVSPHSSGTAPVQQLCATQAQQSQAPHLRTSPTGRCSPQSFVVSRSMTSSSVGDACNLGLNRQPSYRSEAYGSQHRNSLGHHSQQQPNNRQRNALPQPLDQHSSDVVDTVSRSLNTHNDPELEELSPMHHDNESEDEMVGHATDVAEAAGHATALYSKGFLISTSSAKHSSTSHGNDGGGTYIPSHLYDGKEQQPSRDDGEAATSQASRSRGPLAITTAAGISHRLLTTDEINERRRVSRAASRSVSQVHSAVAGPAIDDNAGSHTSSVNPRLGIQTTNSNLNTPSGVCKGSRPAHRRLTKEETDQLIAHRQQQQTADTATVAAVAAAVTDITSPSKQQQQHQHQHQHQQHELSSSLASMSHNNNHSGALHSAPLDSAQPWLLSEEGPQSNYFPPAPASTLQPASTSTMGSGGCSTLTKPMALEWLRGTHGGRTGAGGGAGFLAESTAHSCPGGNGWCDSNVARNHVSGGNVNIKTTMTAFLGATRGAAGDGGSNGDSNASAGTLTGAGQAPGSASTTGFTWLPNTSNWSPHHQPPLQGLFSSVPAAPPQFGSSGGTTNAATWGYNNTSIGFPSGSLRSGSLTFLSSPTPAALHGMSQEAIEECIRQCDSQLEQLRQEREQLVQELQRRLYAAAKGEKPQLQSHNYIDAVGWPGALNPNAVAIPCSAMGTVTARTSMPPRGTSTAGSGSSGGGGGAARQRPLWPFLGDFVMNGDGVANALPRGLVDTRKPPGPCTEPTVEVVSGEWLRSAPAAAAGHQWSSSGCVAVVQSAHQAATDTSAVGGSVGNWTAEERSGSHGRRRAETGKQRKKNDGNNNGASSSAGTRATTSNTGGGGHSASHRCSHDNTPQEEKYLQTDPFSMYMHNKKIVTSGAATPKSSSRGRHGDR